MADDADKEKIDQVEADRRKLERALLLFLLLVAEEARQHAQHAVRLGVSPALAVSQVINGAADLNQPGVANKLQQTMLDSYMAGSARTLGWLKKAGSVDPNAPVSNYRSFSQQAASLLAANLIEHVEKAVSEGSSVQEKIDLIDISANDAGLSKSNASYLELVSEEAILKSYNDGMFAGYLAAALAPSINSPNEPQTDIHSKEDTLKGFKHKSVIDSRTTDICEERENFTRPYDDPYWKTNWPKLHFRCRSVCLPISTSEWKGSSGSLPTTKPQQGFGLAPTWLSFK